MLSKPTPNHLSLIQQNRLKRMKSRFFRPVMMIMVHILSANCRHFPPTAAIFTALPHHQGPTPLFDQFTMGSEQGGIGSSPPSCERKCNGCSPCEAAKVPTNVGVRTQYSNYEPEAWKCKCGPTFYSP